jgi:hypothetical protein
MVSGVQYSDQIPQTQLFSYCGIFRGIILLLAFTGPTVILKAIDTTDFRQSRGRQDPRDFQYVNSKSTTKPGKKTNYPMEHG